MAEVHAIFGAGPVGVTLARQLIDEGRTVRVFTRSGRTSVLNPPQLDVQAIDATNQEAARRAVAGADVVYQCANIRFHRWKDEFPLLSRGVRDAAAHAGAKLVILDNLYAYQPPPTPFNESAPENATTTKGQIRREMAAEALAAHREGRVRVSIARPSDFYGPYVVEAMLGGRSIGRIQDGKTAFVLGNSDMPHSFTYVPDVARALALLGQSDEGDGRIWFVPNAPAQSTRQVLETAARLLGKRSRVFAARRPLMAALGVASPLMKVLTHSVAMFEQPYLVDGSAFERAFGLAPTPLEEGLEATVRWYVNALG